MEKENSHENDLKRKHPEVGESSYPIVARGRTSSPNDLTSHHHVPPSHPPTLQPLVHDHVFSPWLGFLPEQAMSTILPARPQNNFIDFMGLSSQPPPPPPREAVDVAAVASSSIPPISASLSEPSSSSARSNRRNPTQGPRQQGKSETITPPFPWATNKRAVVHNINYLYNNKIYIITGDVYCKKCDRKFKMEFNLREKFKEVWDFIRENKNEMRDRAADKWMNPVLPTCMHCGEKNSVRPITQDVKKKSMNWLFLLLGEMLGCCTLGQLKYFCKHTKNHRTGAKDRVLYLTYLALCKQLQPEGPFNR